MTRAAWLGAVLFGMGGCAILTAAPPKLDVASVQLRTLGVPAQVFDVVLCVTNPNDGALRFASITAAIDVAGAPLADGTSDSAVVLPPHASVPVPFTVATTVLNLAPQLASVLRTGAVDYRLHGTVRIASPIALTLPFGRSGRLDLIASVPDLLTDAAAGATACGASSR